MIAKLICSLSILKRRGEVVEVEEGIGSKNGDGKINKYKKIFFKRKDIFCNVLTKKRESKLF